MKTISLWQPWASAIAAGLKTIETRSWPTKYRGQLAIHAAKRDTQEEKDFWLDNVLESDFRELYGHAFLTVGIQKYSDLPHGAIVAICEIYSCLPTEALVGGEIANEVEKEGGNFSPLRYGWQLRNIEPLAIPVPCIGRQGFFDWDQP